MVAPPTVKEDKLYFRLVHPKCGTRMNKPRAKGLYYCFVCNCDFTFQDWWNYVNAKPRENQESSL